MAVCSQSRSARRPVVLELAEGVTPSGNEIKGRAVGSGASAPRSYVSCRADASVILDNDRDRSRVVTLEVGVDVLGVGRARCVLVCEVQARFPRRIDSDGNGFTGCHVDPGRRTARVGDPNRTNRPTGTVLNAHDHPGRFSFPTSHAPPGDDANAHQQNARGKRGRPHGYPPRLGGSSMVSSPRLRAPRHLPLQLRRPLSRPTLELRGAFIPKRGSAPGTSVVT